MDYNAIRRKSRAVKVGALTIGGEHKISIQSMTNTDPHDIEATYKQVLELEAARCDIIRLTVPDEASAEIFRILKSRGINTPLVADVHFSHKIAVAAVRAGADKLRINPGNIGSRDKIREVVSACKEYGVPIRIGVNSGSLEEDILKKYGAPTPEALVESALRHEAILGELDFHDTVISVKSSSTYNMLVANRILKEKTDTPLHLGVTEAGAGSSAIIKSSIGIGTLLSEGIGDTVRVSLTANPIDEVRAAREILSALDIGEASGVDIISCPTCGRTKIDLISLCSRFKSTLEDEGLDNLSIKVALMGCAVNGPGEAREADIGIAGGDGCAVLFKKGEIVGKISESEIIPTLIKEIKNIKQGPSKA
ncbi:MAG: flavodoxin-dependent (E)-4-hydroxy-3-methylbut-2-enyl-diphosphate synthase [Clostridia bacterium]|nr:flavodoxin-dependent (E)-4-hydroxy-3-methylbut-2-enyl-diphosphate synthase [Clostridia bacterium]